MKKALIFYGGWEGHEPEQVAHILKDILSEENFEVRLTDTLQTLEEGNLNEYDLIVPNWTQGTIKKNSYNLL